jgi:hypothetical protein
MHVMCNYHCSVEPCLCVLVCACVYAKWFAVCCSPDLIIGGQDKAEKKTKEDKQRSRDAVESKSRRRSGSSSAEAEVEGEDEVLE